MNDMQLGVVLLGDLRSPLQRSARRFREIHGRHNRRIPTLMRIADQEHVAARMPHTGRGNGSHADIGPSIAEGANDEQIRSSFVCSSDQPKNPMFNAHLDRQVGRLRYLEREFTPCPSSIGDQAIANATLHLRQRPFHFERNLGVDYVNDAEISVGRCRETHRLAKRRR